MKNKNCCFLNLVLFSFLIIGGLLFFARESHACAAAAAAGGSCGPTVTVIVPDDYYINLPNHCGSADGGTFSSAPTSGLCDIYVYPSCAAAEGTTVCTDYLIPLLSGDANPVLSGSAWTWTCYGSYAQSCSANYLSPFSCTDATPLYATLCSGDDQGLTTDTPRTLANSCTSETKCEYTCNPGYALRQDGVCAIPINVVNGACGTANKTYPSTAISFGSDTFCSSGSTNIPLIDLFNSFPPQGGSTSWICKGEHGGSDSLPCVASRDSALPPPSAPSCDDTCNCSNVCKGSTCYDGCGDLCDQVGARDCSWQEVAP